MNCFATFLKNTDLPYVWGIGKTAAESESDALKYLKEFYTFDFSVTELYTMLLKQIST